MTTTELWLTLFIAGALTFALRWSFIGLSSVIRLPRPIQNALQYVPAAVLSAIVLPEVLVTEEQIHLAPDNLRLIAAIIAAFVAWRTSSILYTIIVGMAALWLLNAIGAAI